MQKNVHAVPVLLCLVSCMRRIFDVILFMSPFFRCSVCMTALSSCKWGRCEWIMFAALCAHAPGDIILGGYKDILGWRFSSSVNLYIRICRKQGERWTHHSNSLFPIIQASRFCTLTSNGFRKTACHKF